MSQSSDALNDDLEPDDNIDDWLRRNCPEAYTIARRHTALKRKEHLRYIRKLQEREDRLHNLEEKLWEQEPKVAECKAKLRSWEREEPRGIPISIAIPWIKFSFSTLIPLPSLRLINNIFEWLLKAGLSVVPFLALLSIVGAKVTIFGVVGKGGKDGQSPSQIILLCIIFSAVALTWMTSAYICNLVLSQEYLSREEEEKRQHLRSNKNRKESSVEFFNWQIEIFFLIKNLVESLVRFFSSRTAIFFLIWLSEASIGIATIPTLIGTARLSAMSSAPANATWKDYVEAYEYYEIAIGIGLFALVNILSAIAKVNLGRAIAERDYTKNRISELRNEISVIETKISTLERKIENPEFDLENVFNRSITDLSTLYMQGRDIDGINPSNPGLSDEANLDENAKDDDDFDSEHE
jgi:hypothetical protein